MTLVTGGDAGLQPAEPDDRARPLPGDRPLVENDVTRATFDITWRGYRMAQVDQTLRRLAYDIGYKSELIQVLEAEIIALREGRGEDADTLASTRAAALGQSELPVLAGPADDSTAEPVSLSGERSVPGEPDLDVDSDGPATPAVDAQASAQPAVADAAATTDESDAAPTEDAAPAVVDVTAPSRR
jgi:DivIVA domain-containing protein